MAALFADLPEALASTVEIAQRCAFRPRTHDPILPRFSVGDRTVDEAAELRARAEAGLARRVELHGLAPGRTIEEYRERLAFELKVIEGMKYPGYFLIVSDFIQWAKEQGIPVGPGRGSGAGSLVVLCAHHHRPRSAALRPAVRALPQSRARVDAGLRHRLLPGPPRRGDPLRAGPLRPRSGGADHHLRHAAGARRAARRRPRAGNALRPRRQAVQAGAAESGRAGDARQGDRRRAAPAGRARQRSARQARVRHLAQARRALPPRLDACRRHRDRRPAARRTGADVPRSEIRHAGDPVQHEVGGGGGTGEVRLPRPQDAHRAGDRGEAAQAARRRARSVGDPARRQENLRPAFARRSGRHLPTGKSGHAARAARHAAGPFRGHHRAGRALPARPDGEHPDLLRCASTAARSRNTSIPSSSRSCARRSASSSTRNR